MLRNREFFSPSRFHDMPTAALLSRVDASEQRFLQSVTVSRYADRCAPIEGRCFGTEISSVRHGFTICRPLRSYRGSMLRNRDFFSPSRFHDMPTAALQSRVDPSEQRFLQSVTVSRYADPLRSYRGTEKLFQMETSPGRSPRNMRRGGEPGCSGNRVIGGGGCY